MLLVRGRSCGSKARGGCIGPRTFGESGKMREDRRLQPPYAPMPSIRQLESGGFARICLKGEPGPDRSMSHDPSEVN